MTDFPDFTKLDLGTPHAKATAPKLGEAWETPEGVEVKTAYTEADRAGLDYLDDFPALPRLAAAPTPPCTRTSPGQSVSMRASRRLRTPTPSTAATSPPARKACRSLSTWPPTAAMIPITSACRRCRHGRRGHRLHLRHAHPLLRHSAGQDVVSMTMNGAVLPIMALYIVAAEEQGVGPEKAGRDDPERHPQRVHGPEHLYLSAQAVDADHFGYLRLHVAEHAEVQLDLDLRLSHAGSGRRQTWNWPTRWRTALNISAPAWPPASTWTPSRRASPSSGRSA
jgi:hypothetical protein